MPTTHANDGLNIDQIASHNVFRSNGQPELIRETWMDGLNKRNSQVV